MTILDDRTPGPSLALITIFVAIVTAVAFGGMFALSNINAGATGATTGVEQASPSGPVETGNI